MKLILSKNLSIWEALAEMAPGSSKTEQRTWLSSGRLTLNGLTLKPPVNFSLKEGNTLVLGPKKAFFSKKHPIEILFEDEWIVVVNKPEGLLSVDEDKGNALSLHELLKSRHAKRDLILPYHRLDRETSGVILFCKDRKVWHDMQESREQTHRVYEALIDKAIHPNMGTWNDFLFEPTPAKVEIARGDAGKEAISHYKMLGKKGRHYRLEVHLETGRRHQIRVQAASRGFPLVGDTLYSGSPWKRMGLHAKMLEINHPITQKRMRFEAPVPF